MAMRVNTEVIRHTASTISSLNSQLFDTLQNSHAAVKSLSGVWTGEAATATIQAYDKFATTYFEEYRDMLDQYVKFLNVAAGEGYEQTEQAITRKADEI